MASSGNFNTYSPINVQGPGGPGSYTGSEGLTGGDTTLVQTSWVGTHFAFPSGKWYFEVRKNAATGGWPRIGFYGMGAGGDSLASITSETSNNLSSLRFNQGDDTVVKYVFGSTSSSSVSGSIADGDILQVAIDIDAGKIWYGVNNTYLVSGDPAGGSNAIDDYAEGTYNPVQVCVGTYAGPDLPDINFGQDSTFRGQRTAGGNADGSGFGDFAYSPPTGFLAMCTANLPVSDDIDPAQTDDDIPQKQFNAVLYTGNASTRNITGVDFQPDLVITRGRSEASVGKVVDSSRGVTKVIQTHSNSAESTDSNGLTAFGSDGYSLGSDAGYNNNSTTYVAWCWRCNGGTTTTDTSGDISTVRQTNAAGGFAILEWTGNGSNNQRLAHGLGKKPTLVIAKRLDSAQSWGVWSTFLGANSKEIQLDSNAAWQATGNAWYESGMTTDFVGIGSDRNISSSSNVAYVWTDIEGYSKCGSSYLGNANADGAFVYTGFRPRYIILRAVNVASDGWLAYDTAREPFNVMDSVLQLHLSSAEYSNAAFRLDVLSNGFKLRSADNAVNGTSYDPYIYFAWGDVPYKYNNAQ